MNIFSTLLLFFLFAPPKTCKINNPPATPSLSLTTLPRWRRTRAAPAAPAPAQGMVFSTVLCEGCSVKCAVCNVQCAVFSVQCAMFSVQCAVSSMQNAALNRIGWYLVLSCLVSTCIKDLFPAPVKTRTRRRDRGTNSLRSGRGWQKKYLCKISMK